MRLKAVIIEGFRAYRERTRIELDDLTAFVGRNDAGKSTVLESLEIFFNAKQVKMDKGDRCVHSEGQTARTGCVFTDLPEEMLTALVIDARSQTTLAAEFLLNPEGDFEVHKTYDLGKARIAEAVVAIVHHPIEAPLRDLLLKKNEELKQIARDTGANLDAIDQRSNVALRQLIRDTVGVGELGLVEIPIDSSDDVKKVWGQLEKFLPIYALFRSDRPSIDADDEVKDPLQIAVEQALRRVQDEIQRIQGQVREHATEVATRTLAKLKEMDPALADELVPDFKADPKWDKLFSFTLTGDNGIPVNKRGSGVRRLILLNFFRAEADRRREEKDASGIIYAIEEPETSQNPKNQRLLIEALLQLSNEPGIQVLLTTHTPGIAGLIPKEQVRHIQLDGDRCATVGAVNEDAYRRIAQELGITADHRLQAFLFVEGDGDADYFCHFADALRVEEPAFPDLRNDPRLCIMPLSGSNLRTWIENDYLKDRKYPQIHIYDRGNSQPRKFQRDVDTVNARGAGHWATLLERNEIENYLHPDLVSEEFEIAIQVGADTDLPMELVLARRAADGIPIDELDEEGRAKKLKKLEHGAKKRLQKHVLPRMTLGHLRAVDPAGEIEGLLRRVAAELG